MNSVKRHHISTLVKEYSRNSGTEGLIGFVADTSGMLSSCQELLQSTDAENGENLKWLQSECAVYGVVCTYFLEEISRIVALFRPDQDIEDRYAILGLSVGASLDEIKKAYRGLSLQYHPDTASSIHRNQSDKFIEITKAYHSLLAAGQNIQKNNFSNQDTRANNWRRKKERGVSSEQRKKVYAWTLGLLFVLVIISIIASINHRKRAMIAGLQESKSVLATSSREPKIITQEKNIVEAAAVESHTPSESLTKISAEAINFASEVTESDTSDIEQPEEKDVVLTAAAEVEKEKVLAVPLKEEQNTSEGKIQGAVETEEKNVATVITDNPDINSGTNVAAVETKIPDTPFPEESTLEADTGSATLTTGEISQEIDLRPRIDTFLADYIKAYEQRSIILFSRLFEVDAIENGKPFSTMLPTYIDLFEATSELILNVDVISWQKSDSGVDVRGRFKVYLQYKNSRKISGTGPIRFLLKNNDDGFRIIDSEYEFNIE